jgi:hypothetical protein
MTEAPPATPAEVTKYIGTVLRRQRALIDELRVAELEAYDRRQESDVAVAHAYLQAEGSIPEREHIVNTDLSVQQVRREAKRAEIVVAHLKRMLRHCGDELDGARTAAATLRAEFSVLGMTDEGG